MNSIISALLFGGSGGGGGSSLPSVDTSDNGKILGVSSGAWDKTEIDDTGYPLQTTVYADGNYTMGNDWKFDIGVDIEFIDGVNNILILEEDSGNPISMPYVGEGTWGLGTEYYSNGGLGTGDNPGETHHIKLYAVGVKQNFATGVQKILYNNNVSPFVLYIYENEYGEWYVDEEQSWDDLINAYYANRPLYTDCTGRMCQLIPMQEDGFTLTFHFSFIFEARLFYGELSYEDTIIINKHNYLIGNDLDTYAAPAGKYAFVGIKNDNDEYIGGDWYCVDPFIITITMTSETTGESDKTASDILGALEEQRKIEIHAELNDTSYIFYPTTISTQIRDNQEYIAINAFGIMEPVGVLSDICLTWSTGSQNTWTTYSYQLTPAT